MTTRNLASISSLVLVGTFDGFRVTKWNTADGQRPLGYSLRTHDDAVIYKEAVIDSELVVNGSLTSERPVARVKGGQIGCDQFTVTPVPMLEQGDRYVFFLTYSLNTGAVKVADLRIADAWLVGAGDVVTTAEEGEMPLAELISEVQRFEPVPLPRG